MRFQNRKRHFVVGLLALVLCLAAVFPQISAFADNTVNTQAYCSLTVRVSEQYPELKETPVPVRLYRVADMNQDGSVTTPADAFQSFDVTRFHSDASAEDLETFTQELADFVKKEELQEDLQISVLDSGKAENLSTGLYLLIAESVTMQGRGYVFQPSLISLPTTEELEGGLHNLVYDAEVFLKVGQADPFGDVVIEKTLDTYQADLGTATFVFEVKAVKDGQVVYNDVLSLTFNAPGVKQTVAEHIPAGAVVTVTEIYSGANYQLTSSPLVEVTVLPEDAEGAPVKAAFTNTYTGSQQQSTSVVNHFAYEESGSAWRWEPIASNET